MSFSILTFYLFACLPVMVGGFLWLRGKEVVWQEWLAGSLLGFFMAGLFHVLALWGATADTETWSGHITHAVYYPEWVEEYEEMHTRTVDDGDGKSHTEIYYTTEYRTHHEEWTAYSNINTSYDISRADYLTIEKVFGPHTTVWEHKGGFYSGDHNVYPTTNLDKGEYFPITTHRHFENKVKATPTTFSFPEVPANVKVFPYPKNDNPWQSDRLVGTANLLDILAFDRMNARLGPSKRVNVILVGMGNRPSIDLQWQEAAWVGGKKNDVVIEWTGLNDHPTAVRAFGWTDSKTCLRKLESIVLGHGATNETLPLIEAEIRADYKLKDWDKAFAHISVPPPTWAIWTYFTVAILSQIGFWWWARANEFTKDGSRLSRYYY